ncbi:MAG: glucose 1-dehydrogenase [Ardenticatenaceae bacterium]|nr:glucose 1-dehydrogenase [Ardenticatenaceae bacterium]
MDLFDVHGRVAIVTGGNRGIGLEFARGLGAAGARVVIANRDSNSGEAAAQRLRGQGMEVAFVHCDLSDGKSISNMVDKVVARHGTVDVLVNNGATRVTALALDHSEAEWDYLMKVNVGGVFLAAQAVARLMVAQKKGGSIINISSVVANRGNFNRTSYITSKGAVNSLTIALAMEWAPYGIRVNGLAPGSVETPESSARIRQNEELFQATVDHIPMGRLSVPADLVGAVIFLASDASAYMTGHTMVVDGGWSLAARPMSLYR